MRLFRDVVDLLRLGLEVRFEATAAQLLREGVVSSLCQNMAHIQSLQPHSKGSKSLWTISKTEF